MVEICRWQSAETVVHVEVEEVGGSEEAEVVLTSEEALSRGGVVDLVEVGDVLRHVWCSAAAVAGHGEVCARSMDVCGDEYNSNVLSSSPEEGILRVFCGAMAVRLCAASSVQ